MFYCERTTGFEPATLTLAKREENRPSGPSGALTWCSVRLLVRLVRLVSPDRKPVYHRTPANETASHQANEYDVVSITSPSTTTNGRRVTSTHHSVPATIG